MEQKELKKAVNRIIKLKNDPETAHCEEDGLCSAIIDEFCPEWVKKEINRLGEADFPRWYS